MGVSPSELLLGKNITDRLSKPVKFRREWSEMARKKATATQLREEITQTNGTPLEQSWIASHILNTRFWLTETDVARLETYA